MITVRFYGDLRYFGERYDMKVPTPAQALRLLMVQLKGLEQRLREGSYQVRFKGRDLSEDEVHAALQDSAGGVLHVVPRVQGAGKAGMIVAGIVLIVASFFVPAGWGAVGTMLSGAMTNMGVALVLGGIAQLLTKTPKQESSEKKSRNSTSFSNLANTSAQGVPVPLAYGTIMCGTRLISQSIESYRVAQDDSPTKQAKFKSSKRQLASWMVYRALVGGWLTTSDTLPAAGDLNLAGYVSGKSLKADEQQVKDAADRLAADIGASTADYDTTAAWDLQQVEAEGWVNALLQNGRTTLAAGRTREALVEQTSQWLLEAQVLVGSQTGYALDTLIKRTYHDPVPAIAPDGLPYDIDMNDDSVRAANYTAVIEM